MTDYRPDEIAQSLVQVLAEAIAPVLKLHPIALYLSDLDSLDQRAGYRRLSSRVHRRCDQIIQDGGPAALETYHRLTLVTLIASLDKRMSELQIPPSIKALTQDFARRVLSDVKNPRSGYFRHDNDRFAKDLGVCRLKLLVCGPEVVDLHSGFPRRNLIESPRIEMTKRLQYFIREVGGFQPLYETHMDRRLINEFSPGGYDRYYQRLADLLRMNPDVRGVMFGATWFVDPSLDSISPELAYLRTVPTENGARLFPAPTTKYAIRDAIRLSPLRNRLYEEGEYRPRSYIIVWPRRKLIEWSRQFKSVF